MYTPAQFSVEPAEAARFLASIRAGDLVTMTDDGLVATFLPLIPDAEAGARGALLGHVARRNDQWRRPPRGEAMVILHGLDAYVSPSWYATKAEHGRVVPTWDYTTAHVYGHLRIHDDPAWLDALVRRLTDRHEAGCAEPWSIDDMPAVFREGQLKAIVGVEVEITRVEATFKMSQNRPPADVDGVVAGLEADGRPDAAAEVRRLRPG